MKRLLFHGLDHPGTSNNRHTAWVVEVIVEKGDQATVAARSCLSECGWGVLFVPVHYVPCRASAAVVYLMAVMLSSDIVGREDR
jgi:hypothetical protein